MKDETKEYYKIAKAFHTSHTTIDRIITSELHKLLVTQSRGLASRCALLELMSAEERK